MTKDDKAVDVTARLAGFAMMPVVDADALQMMRLSLLDWAACGIAGAVEPVARIVRQMVEAEAGIGTASLMGSQMRVPTRGAALVNGATSHALDYDDTHFGHIGHPSVAVIPAALAIAERVGSKGAAFLDACLIGVEASVRVGIWLGRAHYQTGFHQTATAGAFGATVAAARLLGLDHAQTTQALGLAATRAAGLKSQFGTMGKPYHAGMAAAAGVEVAQLAGAGFVSRADGIGCDQGFGPTHAGEANAFAWDNLGKEFLFKSVQHKFHACCHGTHAMLEALAMLRGQLDPALVDTVDIVTHPRWLSVCNIAAPTTGLEAKFSYALTAAMALYGQDTGALATFSDAACTDPRLCILRDKVRVKTDDSLPETAARVSVNAGGQTCAATFDLDTPISLLERQARIEAKAGSLLGSDTATRLKIAIMNPGGPDLASLTTCLRR